jgi:NADH-quinone oxidoreductase subunit M
MGWASPTLLALAVVGIVYGALMAYVQTDVKRLVAYSSVSHLGFVVLGIVAFNEQGLQGAILQGVNHGLSTGALFMLVGFLYERRHTREISEFGGVAKRMPVYAAFFVFVTFSSVALPLTNGFVGEFLIFAGSFKEGVHSQLLQGAGKLPWRTTMLAASSIATLGIVLGAVYMLSVVRRVFFGPVTRHENECLHDLGLREKVLMAAFSVFIAWIGLIPGHWLKMSDATVQAMIADVRPRIVQVRAPADYERDQLRAARAETHEATP